MSNPNPVPSFVTLLPKIIDKVEIIALVVTFLGVALKYMSIPAGDQLLIMGLMTISMTLFLRAFMMLPPTQHRYLTLVNKLGYISAASATVGILFRLMHFEGAQEMLIVGGGSLAVVIGVTGLMSLLYEDTFAILKPMLTRIIPIFLLSGYFFFQLQTIQ